MEIEPITRKEQYLSALAGNDGTVPERPVTREEIFLNDILLRNKTATLNPITRNEALFEQIIEGTTEDENHPVEYYNGPYEATSALESDQTLATHEKYLQRDITVKKIPVSAVSNNGGGYTVNIGG